MHDTFYLQTPPHRLTLPANTRPSTTPLSMTPDSPAWRAQQPTIHPKPPVAIVDVYVEDFIGLAQTRHNQRCVHGHLLHSIDAVLCPLMPGDNPTRKEPTSVQKLLQGDGYWTTQKTILGWNIDSAAHTLTLPPHWVRKTPRPPHRRPWRSAPHPLMLATTLGRTP